ncbi:short-chain dehydrogenase [candidate division GN15 bacterium]|uniref:Short-chain dehydrogenase n=1 Tax=candidate division GN15 bacterium TaxID=2072418 RepID=A0A855X236_9BACT|nr:MAG: short-chain dehydrogenase [candidate division GN15 bacterium]
MSTRILITGASRGIGRAIAVRLAKPDRHLLLHGRDRKELDQTAALAQKRGAHAEILLCDLAVPEQVQAMARTLAVSPLHALINNAGIAVVKPLAEQSLEEWQRTLAVNVTAPFLLTKLLAPVMPKGGSIVNILSIAAKVGFANWSSYSMSKAALDGFAKAVREELRPGGIRVINVYPGSTDTDIWKTVPGEWPRDRMLRPEAIADAVAMALEQPDDVVVEDISLGSVGGTL